MRMRHGHEVNGPLRPPYEDTTHFDCIMLRYINKPTSSGLHNQQNLSEAIQHSLSEAIKHSHQVTRQVNV